MCRSSKDPCNFKRKRRYSETSTLIKFEHINIFPQSNLCSVVHATVRIFTVTTDDFVINDNSTLCDLTAIDFNSSLTCKEQSNFSN
jgi:hypothetical protein